jgi:UDP-3-O-[3-hydroxymyristoyl] N-acetylglucosamine deacetylase
MFDTRLLGSLVARPQQTLKAPIGCVGLGVHSGARVTVRLEPAAAGYGVVFRRSDLGRDIPARFDLVADTRLCTVIADPADPAARVGTIEHLMAALAAAGIDNVLVTVDGPELPILDGSSANWSFLIDCAGITAQDTAPLRAIEVCRAVRVSEGEGERASWAELRPTASTPAAGLAMVMTIDFPAAAIGRQAMALHLTPETFRRDLARARTFAMAEEVAALRQAGLARGGSLDNAIVVDGAAVLNPGGLRYADEFVRHKLLDAVGDLALAGAPLIGRFTGHRSGHALNNRLLRALFAQADAWRWADPAAMPLPHPFAAQPSAAQPSAAQPSAYAA